MVGQGVLRECLVDPDAHQVLSIVRIPTNFWLLDSAVRFSTRCSRESAPSRRTHRPKR